MSRTTFVILCIVLLFAFRSRVAGESAQTNLVPEIKAIADRAEGVYKVGETVRFKIEAICA